MRELLAHVATIATFQLRALVNINDYDKDGLTLRTNSLHLFKLVN